MTNSSSSGGDKSTSHIGEFDSNGNYTRFIKEPEKISDALIEHMDKYVEGN